MKKEWLTQSKKLLWGWGLMAVGALCVVFLTGFFIGRLPSFRMPDPTVTQTASAPEIATVPKGEFQININTADTAEMTMLPGIGPVLAQRIVDYREEHGPFLHTMQLMLVEGIGEKTYEELAPYVYVEEVK